MSNNKYLIISLAIFIPIITWLIFGSVLLYYLYDGNIVSQEYSTVFTIFISSTIVMIITMILSKTMKNGKNYWKENSKRQKAKNKSNIKRPKLKDLSNNDYSEMSKYKGREFFKMEKKSFTAIASFCLATLFSIFIVGVILIGDPFLHEVKGYLFIGIITVPYAVGNFIVQCIYIRVQITELGVFLLKGKIRTNFIKWDKIKAIGISTNFLGRNTRFAFIYFTKIKIKNTMSINIYEEKDDILMLRYRPKVIHCIMKYWDGEIKNLDTQKSWLKYINKL